MAEAPEHVYLNRFWENYTEHSCQFSYQRRFEDDIEFVHTKPAEDERVKEIRERRKLVDIVGTDHDQVLDAYRADVDYLLSLLPVQAAASTPTVPDAHSLKRFALSSQCDNTLHSECGYPDRCLCSCHTAAASTEAQDDLSQYEDQLPADMPRADYDAWFERSKVIDGVRMGPRYPFATTPPDFTEQAQRELDVILRAWIPARLQEQVRGLINQFAAEAATAALEQAAGVAADHFLYDRHRKHSNRCNEAIAADIRALKPVAAIGDDKEEQ